VILIRPARIVAMAPRSSSSDGRASSCFISTMRWGGDIGQPNQSRMGRSFPEDELTRIAVDRHQDAIFGYRPLEHDAVARIQTALASFHDIVPLSS
jgi:hypothetical protein